jgi:hypothetical protein
LSNDDSRHECRLIMMDIIYAVKGLMHRRADETFMRAGVRSG